MSTSSKNPTTEKLSLHARNLHRNRYDFELLTKNNPELLPYIQQNNYKNKSIDFSNPQAVKSLNKSLLKQFYGITFWDIPENYLCPPIPGRADYIHYMSDLLSSGNKNIIPTGNNIKVLDIGTGANFVYPIIGNSAYGWFFVGTDIDPVAIISAQNIINLNDTLKNSTEVRLQKSTKDIFNGIIKPGEFFDITMCNPPFHASLEDAQKGTERKWKNLGIQKPANNKLNFGGQHTELWCEGGEYDFVKRMIEQSALFPESCFWYTTLISKKENLPMVYKALRKANAVDVKTIDMAQGQKKSRIVAWTYLNQAQQKGWFDKERK